jgi:pimeloyl-ACP methyl ester carboxylesterase
MNTAQTTGGPAGHYAAAQPSAGSVISRDGTRIGYLKVGQGPAVVLLHGSFESARSHLGLAQGLASAYTCYLPDRRGRGTSGPYPADYSVRNEVEDLEAVLAESGAHRVFGVSAGGLAVLEAARTLPGIRKVAAYEPALVLDKARYTGWLSRFDEELAAGRVSAAMVTSMFGLELAPAFFRMVPRRLLEGLTSMAMNSEDKKAASGAVTMRKLAPTLHYEGVLLAELAGQAGRFAQVQAEVLLMSGSKGLPFLRPGMNALAEALPHCRRVEFAGLDHGGSSDVSPSNRNGKPEVVVPELRRFFADVS